MTKQNIEQAKFFNSKIEVSQNEIVVRLPIGVKSKLNISNNEIYWTVINGVVQISGDQPLAVIPVLSKKEFNNKNAERV